MSAISMYKKLQGLSAAEIIGLKQQMRYSKELYARVVYSHIVHDVPDFHSDLYRIHDRLANNELKYAALVLFRGAAKSTLKTISSSHDIDYNLEKVTVFTSEAADQAMIDLATLQTENVENEIKQALFPVRKGTVWNAHCASFTNGCFIIAKGFKSRIRGIKFGHNRPSKVVADDFESEQNTGTVDQRNKIFGKIGAQLLPIGDTNFKLIFQGTIVHPESYLAQIQSIDLRPNIFRAPYGVYYEKAICNSLLDRTPTWAKRYSAEWIREKEDYFKEIQHGTRMWEFWQEYFNIPRISSNPVLNMNSIVELDARFITYEHVKYLQFSNGTKINVTTSLGCDPAISLAQTADNTILFTLATMPSEDVVILDIEVKKMEVTEQVDSIFKLHGKYKYDTTTIESISFQMALVQLLRNEQRKRNIYFTINHFDKKLSKSNKFLEGLSVPINGRKVTYIKGCRNIDMLMKEGECFSGGIKEHDDTLDGMYLSYINKRVPRAIDVNALICSLKVKVNEYSNNLMDWNTL